MKKFSRVQIAAFVVLGMVGAMLSSCTKKSPTAPSAGSSEVSVVNMISDTAGFSGARIDSNLVNAWGIAFDNTGKIWVASNGPGLVDVYTAVGAQAMAPVTISPRTSGNGGTPSGAITNTTSDFVIPGNGQAAQLLFSSEDGTISAWNSGTSTTVVDSGDTGAVYKGIALASSNGANYLYVTNFTEQRIDVFDKNFAPATGMPFSDPNIPADYGPFNIALIGGNLYVTYAKHKPPENHDDSAGPGNGYVDVYTTGGSLVKRFASQGVLNSPWGLAKAPAGFGAFANAILISNFGDGLINAFDESGNSMGQIKDVNGAALKIDGLWAIAFPSGSSFNASERNWLYFSAGPSGENHGLFGYLAIYNPPSSGGGGGYGY